MRRGKVNRPHGQAVKTSPFHGGNSGSSPDGVTNKSLNRIPKRVFGLGFFLCSAMKSIAATAVYAAKGS